jgi:hypothetical protein
MLYLLLGILSGILLSLVPIWTPSGALEIYPEWHGRTDSIKNIDESPHSLLPKTEMPVVYGSDIYLLSSGGKQLKKINFDNHLISLSYNGAYYAQYDKIGTHVELLNTSGDKFWRTKSMEYPYLSSSGKVILLMNGDHSRIRIMNINGNPAGAKEIYGTLCTVISFSRDSDYSGIGFVDGRYYLLNDKGELVNAGTVPQSTIVKGIAISTNGKYYVVHYGNSKGDFLRLINTTAGSKHYDLQLKHIHLTKTAINVSDSGKFTAIDYDRIILCEDDEIETAVKIPAMKPGLASINNTNNIYFASFMDTDYRANLFVFLEDGTFIFHKIFPGETFIESRIYGNLLLVRGSDSLYCYSLHVPVR